MLVPILKNRCNMLVNPKTFVLTHYRKQALAELDKWMPIVEMIPSSKDLLGEFIENAKKMEKMIREELRTRPKVEKGEEDYKFYQDTAKSIYDTEYAEKM